MTELKDEPIKKLLTILDIVNQLILSLKMVHQAGYVYNDLRPENVAIDFDEGNGNPVATLLNFGLTTKFKYPNGTHLLNTETIESFHGNILFSSLDSMNFHKTSRKDDMVSLYYMMIFLLNNDNIVGEEDQEIEKLKKIKEDADMEELFQAYRSHKQKYSML